MKTIHSAALVTALILFRSTSADGISIGVSFLGDGPNGQSDVATWTLAPGDSAGVIAQVHWNNINSTPTGNVGLSGPLLDSAGSFTAVQLQYSGNDAWNANGPTDTPNEKLMKGVIKEGTGGGGTGTNLFLTFTNLGPGTYDLYVYGDVNDDGSGNGLVDMDVSIGGTTNYWEELPSFDAFGDTFVEATNTDPGLGYMQGNYVKFTGVTPVSGAITVVATFEGSVLCDGLGIAGLQLVTTGSFSTNTTPVAITTQPQPQTVSAYDTATFAVVTTGPVAGYQWFRNGAAILGATNSNYTTPPLSLSNNGDRYKVIVQNNVNSVMSDEVVLTVINIPVAIAVQPEPALAGPGQTAFFSVAVTGPFPSYQWFKNGTAILGATDSSFTTAALSLSDNGEQYQVIVTNYCSSVTSVVAVLTVENDPGTRVASMGANFLGDGFADVSDVQLAPTDAAGVVAQTNWNNISCSYPNFSGLTDPFLDNAGHFTMVQLQFVGNDAWNANGPSDTPNDKLMKGVLKQDGGSMTLTFTNLPAAFYDVYVYGDVDTGPDAVAVSIGTTTNYWTEPASFDELGGDVFTEAASTDPSASAAGNYVEFRGITPASGTITITASDIGGNNLGIAGVQIFSSAAFPTNTMRAVITGQPRPTVAAPGGTATFLVWASGPFRSYQWYKNNVPIAGATSSGYTTPAVSLSDNGARYQVMVSNNVNSVMSDVVGLGVTNDPGTRVASIGANFLGSASLPTDVLQWQLAPGESAGVVAQGNWNNLNFGGGNWGNIAGPFVGVSGLLLDSAGNATAVQFQINCNDAWHADGNTNTPNDRLMKGVFKQDGGTMILMFTNLAPAFYDVYVYGDVDEYGTSATEDLDVSIGGTTYYWTEPGAFADVQDGGAGFILAASTDPNARAAGNYVRFAGVTPASGTITITSIDQGGGAGGGTTGSGIAGVQIVPSVAFPASATLQPTLVAAVQSGNIVISWDSPASYQLQSSTSLSGGSWANETAPAGVTGIHHSVSLPATASSRFFRLVGP